MNSITLHSERKKDLKIKGDRQFVRELVVVGNSLDIGKGGLYDARSGVVNIWCSPDDKPLCWEAEILKGSLDFSREYVGGLYWNWVDDDHIKFRLDCTPYNILEYFKKKRKVKYSQPILTDDEWTQIMDWLEAKAVNIIKLTQKHIEETQIL